MSTNAEDGAQKRPSTRSKKIRDHRDLRVWRKAGKLAELCRKAAGSFPETQVGLAALICRLADEVPSEIAIGQAQRHPVAYVRHLERARAAGRHLERRLIEAHKAGVLPASVGDPLLTRLAEIERMLKKLMISLELAQAKRTGSRGPERASDDQEVRV